jgi:hypothetical protein
MAYTLDKHDMKLLTLIAEQGPVFMKHPQREYRASCMRIEGYVDGELTVYSVHAGRGTAEFRTRYTITDKGRAVIGRASDVQRTDEGQ